MGDESIIMDRTQLCKRPCRASSNIRLSALLTRLDGREIDVVSGGSICDDDGFAAPNNLLTVANQKALGTYIVPEWHAGDAELIEPTAHVLLRNSSHFH
jgi:hypothetical protein